jgi:ABC-2 type transport system ATP-binding protein
MPSIEAIDLSKQFGAFRALDGASFKYEGGGAIGYLGPNGAGKTTTLKLFTGLLRPTRGEALVNGTEVRRDPKGALWDLGAMVETPEPYPALTGRETLSMIGEFRGLSREQIRDRSDRYAKELELPPLDQKTAKLSKGQKQRIVLAGILLSDPTVLLLDEPTSGLDPAERVIIRNLLVHLKDEKRLILMSSHLLQEVTEICDQVMFVNHGKILLRDTVANIETRFRTTRLEVEFDGPIDPVAVAAIPGVQRIERVSASHFKLEFDGSADSRAKILVGAQKLGPVLSFNSSELNLESAYLELVGHERTRIAPQG